MNVNNNSQIGNSPSKLIFRNNATTSDPDPLLSIETMTKSRPSKQLTMTTMFPVQQTLILNAKEHKYSSKRRQSRHRRLQRSKGQQQPSELKIQKQHKPEAPRKRLPNKTWSEMDRERDYWYSKGFEDYMEEKTTPLLEAYDWEKMDPKDRRELEQLNAYEGFVVLEHITQTNDEHQHQTQQSKD